MISNKQWLIMVLLLLLILLFFLPELSNKWIYELPINEIATKEVKSPVNIKVLDTTKNERKIKQVKEEFVPVYLYNTDAHIQILNRFKTLVNLAKNSLSFRQFAENVGDEYDPTFLNYIFSIKKQDVSHYEAQLSSILQELFSQNYIVEYLPKNRKKVRVLNAPHGDEIIDFSKLKLLKDVKRLILQDDSIDEDMRLILKNLLRPNLVYDHAMNDRLLNDRIRQIKPEYIVIRKNEVLLRPGDVVTESIAKKLNIIKEYRHGRKFMPVLGQYLILVIVLLAFYFYLMNFEKKIFYKPNLLLFVFVNILLNLIIIKVVVLNKVPFYLVPIAFTTIILYLFIPTHTAIMASLISVIAGSFFVVRAWEFVIYQSVLVFGAVMNTRPINKRNDIMANAGIVAGLATLVILFQMLNYDTISLKFIFYGVLQGFFVIVLVNGTLQFYEWAFGLTSNVTLSELSNMDHPLLKKLAEIAPGTYNHSLIVGNLAASVAEAIGANSLLARVGGYFHDVGKMVKSEYFIENESKSQDKHKKLTPTLSYIVILSHVKEGEKLAKQYKLPRVILDIINQHHGTSVISYFYQKALGLNLSEVKEEDFRYPGPKPQSKEAGIVMLADAIEAAARALPKPTAIRLKGLVREIINQKFIDGQLDECELTLKDLNKISDVLLKGILGVYHQRIEYPKQGNGNSG